MRQSPPMWESELTTLGDQHDDNNDVFLPAGLGVGSLSSPPLAGWLFMLSPMNVMYAVAGMVALQVLTVAAMWGVTRGWPGL